MQHFSFFKYILFFLLTSSLADALPSSEDGGADRRRHTSLTATSDGLLVDSKNNLPSSVSFSAFVISYYDSRADAFARSLRVAAGEVIVCNHVSYVDIVYLASRFSPMFATIPTNLVTTCRTRNDAVRQRVICLAAHFLTLSSQAKLRLLSFAEALSHALWPRPIPERGVCTSTLPVSCLAYV